MVGTSAPQPLMVDHMLIISVLLNWHKLTRNPPSMFGQLPLVQASVIHGWHCGELPPHWWGRRPCHHSTRCLDPARVGINGKPRWLRETTWNTKILSCKSALNQSSEISEMCTIWHHLTRWRPGGYGHGPAGCPGRRCLPDAEERFQMVSANCRTFPSTNQGFSKGNPKNWHKLYHMGLSENRVYSQL